MASQSSSVDFSLTSADHSRLPVMVVPLGELNAPLFSSMLEALDSCPAFQVSDVKGPCFVSFKFFTSTALPRWAHSRVDWSEFAAHKKVLGVIAVCQCMDEEEFEDVSARFRTTCAATPGICDSRCLVFGPEQALSHLVDIRKGFVLVDVPQEAVTKMDAVEERMVHRVLSDYALTMHTQLCAQLKEFSCSFGLADKKIVSERQLSSPLEVERKQLSRNHRKARALKHAGDLHQLAGQSTEAVQRYTQAIGILRSRNDHLWTAAALEGAACAADLHRRTEELLTTPPGGVDPETSSYLKARSLSRRRGGKLHTDSPVLDQRHASPAPPLLSRITTQMVEEMRIDMSDSPLSSPRLKQLTTDPFENVTTISPGASMSTITSEELGGVESGANGVLFGGVAREVSPVSVVFREDGGASGFGSEEEEEVEVGAFEEVEGGKVRLDRDYTISKFQDALVYYAKAGKDASVPFVETLLKFAKFLAESKNYERTSEALHRLYMHKFLLCLEDQVPLIQTIAGVYRSIHFHRNAAHYTFLAATQAIEVASRCSSSQLHFFTAYSLLMESLSGYQMSLDPEDNLEIGHNCWPQIQARLLLQLLFLTKRLQQNSLVIRHATFLLQYLHVHLSEADLQQVTDLLQGAANEREAGQEDRMLPFIATTTQDKPVALSKIPTVQSFIPQPLNEVQKPYRYRGYTPPPSPSANQSSPFIYSALQHTKEKTRAKETWVSETPIEVFVEIANPLPFKIQVEDIRLWAEPTTVALETTRNSLTLPPSGVPQQLTLYVIPHGTGEVQVNGYRAQVFGVKSLCRVQQDRACTLFTVLPTLPALRVRPKLLPPPTHGRLTTDQILELPDLAEPVCLLDGEGSNLALMLDTSRATHVSKLSLTLLSPPSQCCSLEWQEEELESVLPLAPHSRCYILLKANAHYPAHSRVLVTGSNVDGDYPGGGYHNTVSLDPRRHSYGDSNQSLKTPSTSKPFSRVTRLMDRIRGSAGSRSKTMSSHKYSTMDSRRVSVERPPPGSHWRKSKTLSRPTLPQSMSVTSLRSYSEDTPTRRCVTPSVNGSDSPDDADSSGYSGRRSSMSPPGTAYPDPRRRRAVAVSPQCGSLLGASLSLPSKQTYEGRFVAEYTGGQGAVEGYYRKLNFSVTVQLQPSFVFGQFSVEPNSSDSQFVFVFSALNSSPRTLQLLLSIDTDVWTGDVERDLSWELEAKAATRISIPLRKFNIAEKGAGESLNPELYAERIASCLRLSWQNRSLGRRGTTSLKGFSLSPHALTLVRPQQVTFSLLVNGVECGCGSQVHMELGRKAVVQLTMTNTSGSLLSRAVVQLRPWQEVQGGVVDRQLRGKVVHSSSLSVQVPQLAPNEKFSLNTTLVFVCTGSYQLQPVCCVPGATAYPTSGGVAVREWAQLLGVQPSLPDDDLMQQMLTETMSDVILGTSTEVRNKRHSRRSQSPQRPIPTQKRIEIWKQLSGDYDTALHDRGQSCYRGGTPPTVDVMERPLPTITAAQQVDGTLSRLHDNGTVPQLSDLLSVLARGGSTVEVKPSSSEASRCGGKQATDPFKMADVYSPSTVSMATPRTKGLPVADRSVSICAGPKVCVAVGPLPQHTTSI